MLKNNYLFYKDYLVKRNIMDKYILISKTKDSYLIGPLIDKRFDEISFYKRITSSSIYSLKIYKKMSKKKCLYMIAKYSKNLNSNEVLEISKDHKITIHKIIKVPRGCK